jgi:hypothetical protein
MFGEQHEFVENGNQFDRGLAGHGAPLVAFLDRHFTMPPKGFPFFMSHIAFCEPCARE